jgi:hypothetical protein
MERDQGKFAAFKALQDIFPQVDLRILKATVLDHGADIDAAVDFILTEVLTEQPNTGNLSATQVKEPSANCWNADLIQLSSGNLCESELSELNIGALGAQAPAALPVHREWHDVDDGPGTTDIDAVDAMSPYFDMSLPLTRVMRTLLPPENASQDIQGQDPADTDVCASLAYEPPHLYPTDVGGTDNLVLQEPSLCGNGLNKGSDVNHLPVDVESSTLGRDGDETLAKSEQSVSSPVALLPCEVDPLSSVETELVGQLQSVNFLQADDGSRLLESSELWKTMEDSFVSSCGELSSGSLHVPSMDVLHELIIEAKSDKEGLVGAVEEMQVLQQKVEEAEEAAQQAKKDALHSGSDILAQVDEMRDMLSRAREANEMHAGEVYGEKSMLATESRELQSRLAKLKAENEKAFSAINEMRKTLQARIDAANEEKEKAFVEKQEREASARKLLAIEEDLMAKVAQESRDLQDEDEACTKLREFLIEHGSIIDSLQGEVAVVCEDVETLKKQLEQGVMSVGSSFVHTARVRSSRSSSSSSIASVASGGEGTPKLGEGGEPIMTGSSPKSATRAETDIENSPSSAAAEEVARMPFLEGEAEQAMPYQNTAPFDHNVDSGMEDEGWHLLDMVSTSGSEGSGPQA